MKSLLIRAPQLEDEKNFLDMITSSQSLHFPWVNPASTSVEFRNYVQKSQQPNQKSFFLYADTNEIIGVFNVSEIIRGCFQSAFLGFYANVKYAGRGHMKEGLKLVIQNAFTTLELHRLEANIQPENISSINLVKSCGFRKEGFSPHYLKINEIWRDHEHWAITYEDTNISRPSKNEFII